MQTKTALEWSIAQQIRRNADLTKMLFDAAHGQRALTEKLQQNARAMGLLADSPLTTEERNRRLARLVRDQDVLLTKLQVRNGRAVG